MGAKIWFIIIIIVVLGMGLYLYSSGAFTNGVKGINALFPAPSSTGSSGTHDFSLSSFWNDLGISGSSHAPTGPSLPAAPAQKTTISAPSSGVSGSNATTTINPADIPTGYTVAQLSPYFHEVRIAGASAGTSYYYGTITLNYSSYNNSTGTIDITGWQIKSRNSGEYIPQAINVYDPSGLTPASDIRIKTGDTVSLYSTSAPFNLRLNECVGYIAKIANFVPALPSNCPYIDRSQIDNFTGACQNYIESIGACQAPNMSSSQIPQNDYACIDYLENNFNYKSCFAAHDTDANFLSNQVWVWIGSSVVDQYHDTVRLIDKNGLLVDLYTY
jgi:hypothetical protein